MYLMWCNLRLSVLHPNSAAVAVVDSVGSDTHSAAEDVRLEQLPIEDARLETSLAEQESLNGAVRRNSRASYPARRLLELDKEEALAWMYSGFALRHMMCPIGAYMCHRGRRGWSGTSGLRQNRGTSTH